MGDEKVKGDKLIDLMKHHSITVLHTYYYTFKCTYYVYPLKSK